MDQTEAVGHAVRATYMYSGMADVAALTGDAAYVNAIDRIWENVVGQEAVHHRRNRRDWARARLSASNYELPNMTAYNETCAAVGNDYWNHRLFLLHARRQVHRRHGADALQRCDLRRLARREDVLLSESARIERPARAQSLVRRGLLPRQHHALHGRRSRLRVRAARNDAL